MKPLEFEIVTNSEGTDSRAPVTPVLIFSVNAFTQSKKRSPVRLAVLETTVRQEGTN